MESRAFFKWLTQTPLLAFIAALALIVFVVGLAETATGFLHFPGWVIEAVAAALFALFLLLITFQHQQTMDGRLAAIEGRADDLRAHRLAELSARIPKLLEEVDAANDDTAVVKVRPEIASTMMSLDREFELGLDLTSVGDPVVYVTLASGFLLNTWPFLRDNHLRRARNGVEKYNEVLAEYLDEKGLITSEKRGAGAA